MDRHGDMAVSPKSYGVAVALSMIFGVVGVHHFYLGNWLHGLLDFSMLVIGVVCVSSNSSSLVLFGGVLLLIDVLHTIVVTYLLFVGKCRDGQGRLVPYPGQIR